MHSQANNAYIFPALGHAALLTHATSLRDDAFLAAAEALAELADPARVSLSVTTPWQEDNGYGFMDTPLGCEGPESVDGRND